MARNYVNKQKIQFNQKRVLDIKIKLEIKAEKT